MASAWADRLPRVTVPRDTHAKRATLVLPYYRCPIFFALQLRHLESLAPALAANLSVIVVDDGSPEPAHVVLSVADRAMRACQIRLFRIDVDVPWNWLAARNIGAHHAEDGWLLLTDMDHLVPAPTLDAVIYGQHDPRSVYVFSRVEHTGQPVAPHSASFLMTRDMFWRIGGYDERLAGVYGTDGPYRTRVATAAPIKLLSEVLVRYEFVHDSSVTSYERKTPTMAAARAKRLARVTTGPPAVLSFPYHEVPV